MTTRRKIRGCIADNNSMCLADIEVRFTSDSYGESLSLQTGNLMIEVPFEAVKPIIQQERKKKGSKK